MWKPIPLVASVDIQDKDECIVISTGDDNINLTEEIGNQFQDTSSGGEVGDGWFKPN